MKYYKIVLLWFIITGLAQIKGYSQDSLSFYLEQAALNNPGVKARYLEYSAALEKVPQAASLPDPQFQLGYFLKPMELLGGNQVASLQLMQMFPWFGTLKAAKDEASKMAMAKFEGFSNAKEELYFNVKASYYKLYRTKKEIDIAQKNLGILHALEQLALIKFRSGGAIAPGGTASSMPSGTNSPSAGNAGMGGNNMSNQGSTGGAGNSSMLSSGNSGKPMGGNGNGGMVNLLRVQIEIHALENRIALLNDQLGTDKVSFNRYLNRAPSSDVFMTDSLASVTTPADIPALADSLADHPMVKMYQAESEANASKLTMVTRMGYPMVGLGLNYNVIQKREGNTSMMNGKDMIMPMVTLTLPIYRKKYKAMRSEAEFMRDAATASAEEAKNNLRVNFQQTMQDVSDADRRVKLYIDQASLADKSVQLLIASFSASGSDFEEVLRMEQQLLDYQFKQVEAVVDKNSAIAQLVYLTDIK